MNRYRRFILFGMLIIVGALAVPFFSISTRAQYYPPNYNSLPPDQQYQERQRVYREQYQQNLDRYRQQQENQQNSNRGGGGGYGAIAYGPKGGDYGYSFGYSSRSGAEQRAKKECGAKDCEIAAWFQNSCGAVAVGEDGTWAGGNGNTEKAARDDALADCKKDGGKNCEIIFARCSR